MAQLPAAGDRLIQTVFVLGVVPVCGQWLKPLHTYPDRLHAALQQNNCGCIT